MRSSRTTFFAAAGAVVVALLGIPVTSAAAAPRSTTAASAAADPTPAGAVHYATFTVTPTGTTVTFVGTTRWTATEAVTGTHPTFSGSHPVSSTALPAAQLPAAPEVRKGLNVAGVPGARGASSVHGPRGRLTTVSTQSISATHPGLTPFTGTIDAFDQGLLHPERTHTGLPGVDVEPPDQALCANGTYTVEMNNEVMQVFTSTDAPMSAHGMALENLFGTPEIFGATTPTGTLNVQGDVRCQWDPQSHRWFASQLWLTESGAHSSSNSRFGWSGVFLAVSATTTPTGAWHVFFVPDMNDVKHTTTCNGTPVTTLPPAGTANPCFGDQPLLGMDGNAVYLATNEYSIFSTTLLGAANVYLLSKQDLTTYTPTASSSGTPLSPIYWTHVGTVVPPYTSHVKKGTRIHPWYSIVPAVSAGTSPTTTLYALSNVTYFTTGGTKVAEWSFSTTSNVTGDTAPVVGGVAIATTKPYSEPPLATQKAGTTPLGTLWNRYQSKRTHGPKLKEGPIQTNTDRMTTAAYDPVTGTLWGALNTGVTATGPEAGIAWFSMKPSGSGHTLSASTVASGDVALAGADVMFPSIAFTTSGKGLMDMSLSGPSYYPSTAYTTLTSSGPAATVHIAFAGAGPQDGFTEYTGFGTPFYEPRWGDYSTAVASGTTFYFASEAIAAPNCSVTAFLRTFTCGGTRDLFANWGTSVSALPAA
ncbi:MAG: hypothetical protein ACYCSX_12345 [Acidimicrobiales bacterium]